MHLTIPSHFNACILSALLVTTHAADEGGGHDFIGSFKTSVNDLLAAAQQTKKQALQLNNPAKRRWLSYWLFRSLHSGKLHVDKAAIVEVPSFLDYLRGGCQINLMVAIDFTGWLIDFTKRVE